MASRLAVLDRNRCRPDDCGKACIKYCPMVRTRVEAIKILEEEKKPTIFENLCSGCGICIKKCPFEAISIVNLPKELEKECSYSFGKNSFRLYRLPIPVPGAVLGLIGKNGLGKSTVLKIFFGDIKPNLGFYDNAPDWPEIISYYRGSLLQQYFLNFSKKKLKIVYKPQYVDRIPKIISGKVGEIFEKNDERNVSNNILEKLQLSSLIDRELNELSGGELQRVAIGVACCKDGDLYLFDEPSSYLDVKQRINTARVIRDLRSEKKSIIVAEHDLAVIDYLSDYVSILYGEPSVYGVVSHPSGVGVGINTYLEGYLSDENIRFRDFSIIFQVKPPTKVSIEKEKLLEWGDMIKFNDSFTLNIEAGLIHKGEVIGILGPNGIGKTTFIKIISGLESPDKGEKPSFKDLGVSYKPQYISTEYEGKVGMLLRSIAKEIFDTSQYKSEIIHNLSLEKLIDRELNELSGGELQRVAIAACLSKEAKIYLLDEPSAYLDVEERLIVAKLIRGITEDKKVTAFVVEHDVIAQDFIADNIMVFDGEPGINGFAHSPINIRDGMNNFLRNLEITFRRDPKSKRPRVNKESSRLDSYQKKIGEYYYIQA